MANPNDAVTESGGVEVADNASAENFTGNVQASLSTDGSTVIVTERANPTTIAKALGSTGIVSLDPTLGRVFTLTPTGAITLNAASAPAGAVVTIVLTTSGTSSFTTTFGTKFKSTGTLASGTVSAKVFTITFIGDGTNLNEFARTTAM